MKKAITSLLVVVCAVLTTSFVLPADKKSHVQQSKLRFDDYEIEIYNLADNVNFEVFFRSQSTGQLYSFVLQNGSDANGGLPQNELFTVWVTSNDPFHSYEMDACWENVEVDGPSVTNISVGPGCYQFYIHYNP